MEVLGFDNILGEQDIENLFVAPEETSPEEQREEPGSQKEEKGEGNNNSETQSTTEAVDPDALFMEDEEEKKPEQQSESVGSEKKEVQGQGDAATEEGSDTSPQQNFYSSIANALAVDGIFPNLDEETISKCEDAEAFSNLIEAEVNARLDEKQRKLSKALENGVEPASIRMYENALRFVDSITEEALLKEDEDGEQLRRNVIYQDYVNKGYSKERAQKMTERSVSAGNDIEDAKEALQSNKEFFQKQYDNLLDEAQKKADEEKAERENLSKQLQESLMKDKNLAGNMEISRDIRQKAFEAISKPVYKDPESGEYMTALQKFDAEHHADFIKYAGLFMAMTDGFKNFDFLTKADVNKKVRKGLEELENKLSSTRRTPEGRLNMVSSVSEDPDSHYSGEIRLAL